MELMTKSCYKQFSGFAFNCYLMIIGEWYLSKRKLYSKLTIFFWSEQSFIFFKQWPYIIITTTDFLRLYHCDLFPVTVNIHCLSIPCSCTWYSSFWLSSAIFFSCIFVLWHQVHIIGKRDQVGLVTFHIKAWHILWTFTWLSIC